jgi:DNA-3-methyladenine glycosylase
MVKQNSDFTPISQVLKRFNSQEDKYISQEFQKYGYDLARDLGDLKNRSLYIKLAKEEPRFLLERIKHQVLETGKGSNLGKLFMWKLKQVHWQEKLMASRLARDFFSRPADIVAPDLLGKILVVCDQYQILRAGEITETEAYLGEEDLASHARFGNQSRSAAMFGLPGSAYIYLIYGQHQMFNIVAHSGKFGSAGAVLLRSLKPLVGGKGRQAVGPGKLTAWLKIDQSLNGEDLTSSIKIWVADGKSFATKDINSGPRVGVDYAKSWAEKPFRFWPKRCRYLSR